MVRIATKLKLTLILRLTFIPMVISRFYKDFARYKNAFPVADHIEISLGH